MIEWRPIPSLPGYTASSDGRIKRLAQLGADGRRLKELILRQSVRADGYRIVSVLLTGERRYGVVPVHRLVCEAFHGAAPRPDAMALHFPNGKDDNSAANLRWGTAQENTADAIRAGTFVAGERHHRARLTESDVRQIRASSERLADLAERFDVRIGTIWNIRHRRAWKHVA